jgi:hypothetical protein
MTATQMEIARAVSTLVAAGMAYVSWRWKNAGRLLFVFLFLWASGANLYTSIVRPEVYLEYAPLAALDVYRWFILGPFARHITLIVGAIAISQLAIALLVALWGTAVRLGLIGAMVFLVAIAPLGIGSGFPATLIMALAAALLLPVRFNDSLGNALHRVRLAHPATRQ